MEGYLTKRGGFVHSWKLRWFVGRSHTLTYYVTEADVGCLQPKGLIDLQNSRVWLVNSRRFHRAFCFAIESKSQDRTFYIHADTEETLNRWLNFLKSSAAEVEDKIRPTLSVQLSGLPTMTHLPSDSSLDVEYTASPRPRNLTTLTPSRMKTSTPPVRLRGVTEVGSRKQLGTPNSSLRKGPSSPPNPEPRKHFNCQTKNPRFIDHTYLHSKDRGPQKHIANIFRRKDKSLVLTSEEKRILKWVKSAWNNLKRKLNKDHLPQGLNVPVLPPDPKRKWNAEFQSIFDLPSGTLSCAQRRRQRMKLLIRDFRKFVRDVAITLVYDGDLSGVSDQKSLARGVHLQDQQFSYGNVSFSSVKNRFASYPGKAHAATVVGNEICAINALINGTTPANNSIHVPLMAIALVGGHAIAAVAEFPVVRGYSSLLYGSADAGRSIQDPSPEIQYFAESIAQRFHLAKHTIRSRDTRPHELCLSFDTELHLSKDDNRYYLIELARLIPPVKPRSAEPDEYLWRHFRPEYMQYFISKPLSSDTYAPITANDPSAAALASRADKAFFTLITDVLSAAAQRIDEMYPDSKAAEAVHLGEARVIVELLHGLGINMRHLGKLYHLVKSPVSKLLLLFEMTLRAVKYIIRRLNRHIIDMENALWKITECEHLLVLRLCHTLTGVCEDSLLFWTTSLHEVICDKYGKQNFEHLSFAAKVELKETDFVTVKDLAALHARVKTDREFCKDFTKAFGQRLGIVLQPSPHGLDDASYTVTGPIVNCFEHQKNVQAADLSLSRAASTQLRFILRAKVKCVELRPLRELDEVKTRLADIMNIKERLVGGQHPELAPILVETLDICERWRDECGKDSFECGLQAADQLFEIRVLNGASYDTLQRVGDFYSYFDKHEKAIEVWSLALEDCKNQHGFDDRRVGRVLHDIGIAHQKLGQFETARHQLTSALQLLESIKEQAMSSLDQELLKRQMSQVCVELGNLALEAKNPKEALSFFDRADVMLEGVTTNKAAILYKLLLGRALLMQSSGEYLDSIDPLTAAASIVCELHGGDHIDHATILVRMADAYKATCEHTTALQNLNSALLTQSMIYGSSHMLVGDTFQRLGDVHAHLEEDDASMSCYQKALDIYTKHLAPDHDQVQKLREALAAAHTRSSERKIQCDESPGPHSEAPEASDDGSESDETVTFVDEELSMTSSRRGSLSRSPSVSNASNWL